MFIKRNIWKASGLVSIPKIQALDEYQQDERSQEKIELNPNKKNLEKSNYT